VKYNVVKRLLRTKSIRHCRFSALLSYKAQRCKSDKENEHLRKGAYTDVRDLSKAQFDTV